jgi:hypothetical protein
MDPFVFAAIVLSALALAASLLGLRYSKEANRISKEANAHGEEANKIARQMYEAENVPKISMSLKTGYIPLAEDGHYGAHTPILIGIVKNEGRIPITISRAYIAYQGQSGGYAFGIVPEFPDMDKDYPFPKFPYPLEGWKQVQLAATSDVVAKMIYGLNAKSDDLLVIRIFDTIERPYETGAFRAGDYMRKRRVKITKITEASEELI